MRPCESVAWPGSTHGGGNRVWLLRGGCGRQRVGESAQCRIRTGSKRGKLCGRDRLPWRKFSMLDQRIDEHAAIEQALARQDFTRDDAREVMNEIFAGDATPAQIAGFLVALRAKGETADE